MTKRTIDVTTETVQRLSDKLDALGEQLSDDERALLTAIVTAGTPAISAEVQGFGSEPRPIDQFSLNFMLPGQPIRLLSEVSGLKFEVDIIETR